MDDKIRYALQHTELVRPPQRGVSTFGSSVVDYYVVTGLAESISVVRDGKVLAEKPRIVTPSYLTSIEGFSKQARKYVESLTRDNPGEPGIFYRYKNEPHKMDVVSQPLPGVIGRLKTMLDENPNPLSAIIKGEEETWDVSLLMFIYELTRRSLHSNLAEFSTRGLMEMDSSGLPADAREHIEQLFEQVRNDLSLAPQLVAELNRWGVFNEYQDRFFSLFRGR